MSVGVNTDSVYDKTWWGEGEVKMYMDGDTSYPTINGTGAEDYMVPVGEWVLLITGTRARL